jgi:hypothetical protein
MLGSFGLWASSKGMKVISNLVGKTRSDAQAQIVSDGFVVGVETPQTYTSPSDENKHNLIISQSPIAGDIAPYESSVDTVYGVFNFTPFAVFGFTPAFNVFSFTPFNVFSFTPFTVFGFAFSVFSFTPFTVFGFAFSVFSFTPFTVFGFAFSVFSFTPTFAVFGFR